MRNRHRAGRWTSLPIILALVLAGCGTEDDATSEEPTTSASTDASDNEAEEDEDTIKLGYLAGLTGDYAPFAELGLDAAEIAIEEINEAGGVLGRQVELVTHDNQSTVEGSVQGFSRLVDVENVVAISGVESDPGVAILDAAHEQQIPVICAGCGTAQLDTAGGEYLWRLTSSDTDNGLVSAQFAEESGYDTMSLLVQNTEGAASPIESMRAVFEDLLGNTVAEEVRFDPGRSSYQSEVQNALNTEPDAVYVGAGHEAGTVIFREWERTGVDTTFLVAPDLVVPEIESLSPSLEDGVAIGAISAYDTSTPAYESFAQRFEERTGEAPSPGTLEANMYDSYIALALAIEKAGSTDGEAIAGAMEDVLNPEGTTVYSFAEGLSELEAGNDIDLHGASSSLDVNEYGNLAAPIFSEQHIIDGRWTEVRTLELNSEYKSFLEE